MNTSEPTTTHSATAPKIRRRFAPYWIVPALIASGVAGMVGVAPPAHASPAATVSVADLSVWEGDGAKQSLVVPVTLSTPQATDVKVSFQTADHPHGTPRTDYIAESGTVTIRAGKTAAYIAVAFYGNTTAGTPVTMFDVRLTGVDHSGVDLRRPIAAVRVNDDDPTSGSEVRISDAAVYEGDTGTVDARSNVTLSRPSATDMTITYKTRDSGSTAPDDYKAKTGKVVIRAGRTSGHIVTTVIGDTIREWSGGYLVDVTAVSDAGYSVADGEGYVGIEDDDREAADGSSPTNVVATPGLSVGELRITWSPPSDPTWAGMVQGYGVEYSTDGGSHWSSPYFPTTPTYPVVGIFAPPSARFRVTAAYHDGMGGYRLSPPSEPSTTFPIHVGAPTNVTATRNPMDQTIDVNWTAPSSSWPVTGYTVEYSANGGVSWSTWGTTSVTAASTCCFYTGKTIFRVTATDGVNTGAPSAASKPFEVVVGKPTKVKASVPAGSTGTVELTWVDATATWPATRNVVEYSTDGGVTWFNDTDVPAGGRATLTGLAPGSYKFRLIAQNASGQGLHSTASSAVVVR